MKPLFLKFTAPELFAPEWWKAPWDRHRWWEYPIGSLGEALPMLDRVLEERPAVDFARIEEEVLPAPTAARLFWYFWLAKPFTYNHWNRTILAGWHNIRAGTRSQSFQLPPIDEILRKHEP